MISDVAVKVRALPVMVAVPAALRVTFAVFCPVETTLAIVGSDDVHWTVSVESAGVSVAVNVTVDPTAPFEVAGATLIAVAGTFGARVMVGGVLAAVISS